jgi:beta-glucanase (GH16 family)
VQRAENVSMADGYLRLALKEEKEGEFEYTPGGVISHETFQYGYYEARFRCPPGVGRHTSFWMMRHDWRKAPDEAAAVQEIDVREQDSVNRTSYSVNLHRWKPGSHASYGHKRITTPDLAAEFHVWGCEFTPQRIDYYFDGRLIQSRDATVIPHGPQNIWLTSVAAPLGGTKSSYSLF